MRLPKTINIQIGRKLSDQSKNDIMKEVVAKFSSLKIVAIQIGYEVVRVTFESDDDFRTAKNNEGVRLFGLWCPILGGGPPVTILHIFDFPFEERDDDLQFVLSDFGEVKRIKYQTYLSNQEVYTGTRLVTIILHDTPPRQISINGYVCRIWYKGQPVVCNLCAVQGHKSADCPNRDKCRRCGTSGHFARNCTHAWGPSSSVPAVNLDSLESSVLGSVPGSSLSAAVEPLNAAESSIRNNVLDDAHFSSIDDINRERSGVNQNVSSCRTDQNVNESSDSVMNSISTNDTAFVAAELVPDSGNVLVENLDFANGTPSVVDKSAPSRDNVLKASNPAVEIQSDPSSSDVVIPEDLVIEDGMSDLGPDGQGGVYSSFDSAASEDPVDAECDFSPISVDEGEAVLDVLGEGCSPSPSDTVPPSSQDSSSGSQSILRRNFSRDAISKTKKRSALPILSRKDVSPSEPSRKVGRHVLPSVVLNSVSVSDVVCTVAK